jgi:hypothetical protein
VVARFAREGASVLPMSQRPNGVDRRSGLPAFSLSRTASSTAAIKSPTHGPYGCAGTEPVPTDETPGGGHRRGSLGTKESSWLTRAPRTSLRPQGVRSTVLYCPAAAEMARLRRVIVDLQAELGSR